MLKRILAAFICLVLLLTALPLHAAAASEEEHARIRQQINRTYWKTLSASGFSSLRGYCGVMAGWELYFLGVTEFPITQNGNEMYDIVSVSDDICEGYYPKCYPASVYSIEEALNTITNCGTVDAYNIMLGFHWTSTVAGGMYGHVTVVHAILDGMVYFTEGFITPFNADPSQAMVCTISEFADYYNSWTSFEGLIHFGNGNMVDGCETYGCDLYVTSELPVELLTLPNQVEAESHRTVAGGERLHASAVCKNAEGIIYYQISEDSQNYYVPAEHVEPVWFAYDSFSSTNVNLPQQVQAGKDFKISGVIRSRYNKLHTAVVQVVDAAGEIVLTYEMIKDSYMLDLSTRSINTVVDISGLVEGQYTYNVYCDMINHYYSDGEIIGDMQRVLVASQPFAVGDVELTEQTAVAAARTVKNGWQCEQGAWRYYENDEPRIGWFCDNGVDYYLLADGAAATGWQTINGKNRYFSETGAMRIGWLEHDDESYYMLSNGVAATGLQEIGGELYIFGDDGVLITEAQYELDGHHYSIDSFGKAKPTK